MQSIEPSTSPNGCSKDHVDLLWTSGWDSTFRLLCLAFHSEANVQPYYVLVTPDDPPRNIEIETQDLILEAIVKRDPSAAKRIAQPIVITSTISPKIQITRQVR